MSKREFSIDFGDEVITKQSMGPGTDINRIVAKYQQTGMIEHVQEKRPQYGDVSSVDFKAAMDRVAATKSLFEELPSSARKRFNGSVEEFLDYVQDPVNDGVLDSLEAGDWPDGLDDDLRPVPNVEPGEPVPVDPAPEAPAEGPEAPV